jgi:hypothetical protein
MFAWGAAITALNAWLEPHPKAFTVAGMGVTVAGALLIAWQAAPQCTLGTIQVQPLWAGGPLAAAHALAVPLLGLAAAVRLIGPASDWLRRWWIDYALLLLAAIVLAVVLGWGSAIACALAAVPLGWQLREWTRAARNARHPRRRSACCWSPLPARPRGRPLPRSRSRLQPTRASGCGACSAS